MLANKEYISETYIEFLNEEKKFKRTHLKYAKRLKKQLKDLEFHYKRSLIKLEKENIKELKEALISYKNEIMKLIKVHKDFKDEVIYSRYFMLMAKVKSKQKTKIKKKKMIVNLTNAINIHKEKLMFINGLIKKL